MGARRKTLQEELGEEFYTPEEIGEFLQVSASYVRRLIRSGHLRATLGKGMSRFRVSLEDFKAYLEESRYEPPEQLPDPIVYETSPEMARLAHRTYLQVHTPKKKAG